MTDEKKTPFELTLDKAMERALADPLMRILLWHIVEDRLCVFSPEYAHNASAYSLLAKKQAGLQLLSWMKEVSPHDVYLAESDYNNLLTQEDNNGRGTDEHAGSEPA